MINNFFGGLYDSLVCYVYFFCCPCLCWFDYFWGEGVRCGSLLIGACMGYSLIATVSAATLLNGDVATLRHGLKQDGVVPVVAHLAPVALSRLQSDPASVNAEMTRRADLLFRELGANVLESGRWNNGFGQIGFYVNEVGLKLLSVSNNAISYWPDQKWQRPSIRGGDDGRFEEIDKRLSRDGYVDVEVTWNVDGLQYDIDVQNRPMFRGVPQHREEALRKAESVIAGLAISQAQTRGSPDVIVQRLGDVSSVLRLDRSGVLSLLGSKDVRVLVPIGHKDGRVRNIDTRAAREAARLGSVEVIVTVRDPMGGGRLSRNSDIERVNANRRALESLLGHKTKAAKLIPEFGTAVLRVSPNELRQLETTTDERLLAIEMNRPMAYAAMKTSMPSINLPQVWSKGYKGSGQFIAVLDTGVEKDHPLFRNALGQSRVVAEACFGSNYFDGSTHFESACPQADSMGDSPAGLANSARPVQNCSTLDPVSCLHGTHVSGIATGGGWSGFFGAAPESNLVPIQVFSYDRNRRAKPVAFTADIIAALQLLYNLSSAGNNPIVVNMSLGGGQYSSSCGSQSSAMSQVVANLFARQIPVVAANGNDSLKQAISWPACVPKVIKVGALSNDGLLSTESTFSNMPIVSNFPGEFFFMAPGGQRIGNGITNGIASSVYANSIATLIGTSQAAPHVAGVYAVIKAAVPTATNDDISNFLVANSPRKVGNVPVLRMPNI